MANDSPPRETMEFDVVIVGAGPAGLAAAIRLKQLNPDLAVVKLAKGADSQELLRRIVATGARVRRFELITPSLHQIFLERVGATNVEPGMTGHG